MNLILVAAKTAKFYHQNQLRKFSKKPYIIHPARVAGRASYHDLASEYFVAAGWGHDLLEDTKIKEEELKSKIGEKATNLIKELTNPSKGSKEKRDIRKKMDREHIKTISEEGKVLKLIDRLDNIEELTVDINYDLHIDILNFARLYAVESQWLLEESLSGVDQELEKSLKSAIFSLNRRAKYYLGK